MYLTKSNAGRLLLLALVLTLSACSPAPAATTPTVDPNMIYTAAAKTVQAQFTMEALAKPTDTETPTETLSAPTADMNIPTLAPAGQGNSTPIPGAATAAPQAGFTLTPMATQAGAKPPSSGAKVFQWISNDPSDGTIMLAGTNFDIKWTVKNVGTTTWNKSYTYSYFSGDKYFDKLNYSLKQDVKPGESITVVVDATAPKTSGTYYTWWKMKNDQGANIGDMDLKIVVAKEGETPKAPTATAKP